MVFPSSTMTSRALIGSLRPTAKSAPTVLFGELPIWFSFDAEIGLATLPEYAQQDAGEREGGDCEPRDTAMSYEAFGPDLCCQL